MFKHMFAVAAVALVSGGCSPITIKPITADKVTDPNTHGARFYRPAFFLAIGGDGQGNCQANLVELPDTTQTYVADMTTVPFTSNSFQLTLADGWNLTGVNASSDSTAILSAITGLKGGGGGGGGNKGGNTAMALMKGAFEPGGQNQRSPGIYRLIFANGDVSIAQNPSIPFAGECKDVAYAAPQAGNDKPGNGGDGAGQKPSGHQGKTQK